MTSFILKQLTYPAPVTFDEVQPWGGEPLWEWVLPRIRELIYTSHRIDRLTAISGVPTGAEGIGRRWSVRVAGHSRVPLRWWVLWRWWTEWAGV
jgi:hypothetical protein